VAKNLEERTQLITHLKANGIDTAFHYQSLHKSAFYATQAKSKALPNADHYTDALLRLPLHAGLSEEDVNRVIKSINLFWD
jgi:dTDP-4-amino-4,6-dideoxygalactose transaminase